MLASIEHAKILNSETYQEKYKIETAEIPLFQAHSDQPVDDILEYEPIVVGTYSMSTSQWKKAY